MSDDTKRDEGNKHLGPARTSPYPVSRLAPVHDLVDVAKRIADADVMIGATAGAKLRIIADQIQALQEEARRILEDTRRDLDLHRARCSFVQRPGHTYHLYRRADGELWFSMIGPDEWSEAGDREYVGSYLLGLDQSWKRVEPGEVVDAGAQPQELVRRLLGT